MSYGNNQNQTDHGNGRQQGLDHPVSGTLSTGGKEGGGFHVPGVLIPRKMPVFYCSCVSSCQFEHSSIWAVRIQPSEIFRCLLTCLSASLFPLLSCVLFSMWLRSILIWNQTDMFANKWWHNTFERQDWGAEIRGSAGKGGCNSVERDERLWAFPWFQASWWGFTRVV